MQQKFSMLPFHKLMDLGWYGDGLRDGSFFSIALKGMLLMPPPSEAEKINWVIAPNSQEFKFSPLESQEI